MTRTVMNPIPTVCLSNCTYDKTKKVLSLKAGRMGFPRQLFITSHKTGKDFRFVTVGPEDRLFDEDQWDGTQQIYRAVGDCPTVDHLVVFAE